MAPDSLVRKKIGLIVNPVAGMGGRVGLKGTDGEARLQKALALGAVPIAPWRATETLRVLLEVKNQITLLTCPAQMGESQAQQAGINYEVIGVRIGKRTSAEDTKRAARIMRSSPVDLLIFAGGDGTARDILDVVGQGVPVLGIPAGVKMQSGVFAVNPKNAGALLAHFVRGEVSIADAEVMDVDENAFRNGRVASRLYGYLKVPIKGEMIQQSKVGTSAAEDESEALASIADYVVEEMDEGYYYALGPGTSTKAIADRLGVKKTLLGVDVVTKEKPIASDLNEEGLLKLVKGKNVKLIVSPIGGQGFIFGRGNQQISPEVIRYLGRDNIVVVATPNKIASIGFGRPLLVDTGDQEVDEMLKGYIRVVTGYREETGFRVDG